MEKNSKKLIVETALELFAKNGYDRTPISMIAKEAGVSQGLMYNYFSSKENLLNEIFTEGFEQVKESMQTYSYEKDAWVALEKHISLTFKMVEENRRFWKLLYSIRFLDTMEIRKKNEELMNFQVLLLRKVFKKLNIENPAVEAKIFYTQIDGLLINYLQNAKDIAMSKIKKQLLVRYE